MAEAMPPTSPPRKTSKLALAALVVALVAPIVWFFGNAGGGDVWKGLRPLEGLSPLCVILSAALLLGLIALVWVVVSRRRVAGLGLAVASVLISAFGLSVAAPRLYELRVTERLTERRHICESNIRQLALGLQMYADGHDGRLPPADKWCDCVFPYVKSHSVFVCPEAPRLRCGYALNRALAGTSVEVALKRLGDNWHPGVRDKPFAQLHLDRTVLLYESDLGWNSAGGPGSLVRRPRHEHGFAFDVFAFVDGTGRAIERGREFDLVWNPPPMLDADAGQAALPEGRAPLLR